MSEQSQTKQQYVEPKVTTHGSVQETTQHVIGDRGRCSGFPVIRLPKVD